MYLHERYWWQPEVREAPKPDLALCDACGWEGLPSKCAIEEDGDWESGYYSVHICPDCSGEILDYVMSEARLEEWRLWKSSQKKMSLLKTSLTSS